MREQQPLPGVLPDPSGADFTVSSDPSPGFHTTAVMDGPRRSPGTPAPYTTKEVAYPCERKFHWVGPGGRCLAKTSGAVHATPAGVMPAVTALPDEPKRACVAVVAPPLDQGVVGLDHDERVRALAVASERHLLSFFRFSFFFFGLLCARLGVRSSNWWEYQLDGRVIYPREVLPYPVLVAD